MVFNTILVVLKLRTRMNRFPFSMVCILVKYDNDGSILRFKEAGGGDNIPIVVLTLVLHNLPGRLRQSNVLVHSIARL
jgi:hypothetical protein